MNHRSLRIGCRPLMLLIAMSPPVSAEDVLVIEAQAPIAVPPAVVEDELRQEQGDAKRGKADAKKKQEEAAIKAMAQQYRPSFESILNGQLHLIRDVCRPSLMMQIELQEAGTIAMEESLRACVKKQMQQQRGGFRIGGNRKQPEAPQQAIAKAIGIKIKELGSKEQQELWTAEIERHAEYRKQATVMNLVVLLDKKLVLTDEQREQLIENLESGWEEQWVGYAEMMQHGNEYLPQFPEKLIKPLLNANQQAIWQGLRKRGQVYFDSMNFMRHGGQQLLEKFVPLALEPIDNAQDEAKASDKEDKP